MNWLIIGGAARSGTSAFLKALNSRPDIFLIPEYYWSQQLHSLDKSIFKKYASSLSKINIGKVNNQERPGSNTLLIKDFIEYIPSQDKCLRSIVEAISYSCSGKTGLTYVGEKLPEYWNYVDFKKLSRVFGEKVKLIHIARSPMHTLASFAHRISLSKNGNDRFRFSTFEKAIVHILESYKAYYASCQHPLIDVHFIKYESLFNEGKSIEELGRFLNTNTAGISEHFKGEKYGDLRNLNISRGMIQAIPSKLIHLSSIWDSEENLISEEIKYLWSKNKETGYTSAKILWHYGKSMNSNLNQLKKDDQEIAFNTNTTSNKKESRLCQSLFMHKESLSIQFENDELKVLEKELDDQITTTFGHQTRLDGLRPQGNDGKNSIEESCNDSSIGEILQSLERFLQCLTKLGNIDYKTAQSYSTNFSKNIKDLYRIRGIELSKNLSNDVLFSRESKGFDKFRIDTQRIASLIQPEIKHLLESPHSNEGLDRSLLMQLQSNRKDYREEIHKELEEICNQKLEVNGGLIDEGLKYKLRTATLHYSDNCDTHNYMTRLDDFPKPRLLNMHIDPLFTTRKVMIYLNNVTLKDGPFSYIPTSHQYKIETASLLKIKAFGKANYWPSSRERKILNKLPNTLGLTNVFGSVSCDNNNELWEQIAKDEFLFTGKDNCVVFSPCGMHRGGIVSPGGCRLALQVILDLEVIH